MRIRLDRASKKDQRNIILIAIKKIRELRKNLKRLPMLTNYSRIPKEKECTI